MAQFSMSVGVIKRSEGRSIMAACAYRAGEKIRDQRQGITHDFRHKAKEVEHTELLFPSSAPDWTKGINREAFWNAVDAYEKRKDAQTARDLRIMIPREVPPEQRVALVHDYVVLNFVSKGMVADVCWHNKISATDGKEQPHAHVLLTMRPLADGGFDKKSRHDFVPSPDGRTHADGRPVMVESNADSWNSSAYYERCREAWEIIANAALERAGSDQRIDRRSLLARGLARMPEPALRLAYYLTDLRGCMRERFGQFQMAKHYQAVEKRAKAAFRTAEYAERAPAHLAAQSPKRTVRDAVTPQPGEASRLAERFFGWFDRQLERLAPSSQPSHVHAADRSLGGLAVERAPPQSPPRPEMDYDR